LASNLQSIQFFKTHIRFAEAVLISCLVAIAFVLRYVNYSQLVGYPDEFTYYYRALATLTYNWSWSPQFMLDQPPLYMYILSFTMFVYNAQIDTFRLISVVFGSLTVAYVYFLGRDMFNRFTGLVGALFFAFSGFDILYSRLAQQEALTLFLMTATVYYFWTGVARQKNLRRAIVGGIFLGLAIDTKYVALLLPITFVAYFLLIGRNWTRFRFLNKESRDRLFSKEFWVFILIAVGLLFPVLLDQYLHGIDAFYWDLLGKFVTTYSPFYRSFDLGTIIFSALSSYTQLITFVSSFNAESVFPINDLYYVLGFTSLCLVIVYYFRALLKGWKPETLLALMFISASLFFLIYPSRFQYYQLYTFPAYPLMFARLLDRSANRLSAASIKGFRTVRPLVLFVFILFVLVFSIGLAAGVASAKYGQGAQDDLLVFFQNVKAHHIQNLTIAVTPLSGASFVTYYLGQMNISANLVMLDGVSSVSDPPGVQILQAPLGTVGTQTEVLTLVPLAIYHPQYVVLGQTEYTDTFTTAMKLALAQNYVPLLTSQGFAIFQETKSAS